MQFKKYAFLCPIQDGLARSSALPLKSLLFRQGWSSVFNKHNIEYRCCCQEKKRNRLRTNKKLRLQHEAAATARNGYLYDVGLFPVAFAIVDSDTTANWLWFLHELGKVVDGKRQITSILDRNLGLLEAMPKVFPSAHYGYCLQHLKSNLRNRMKEIDNGFRDHLVSSLGDCAYEPTVVGGMRYGEMTSNAAESFNNWIKEARNLPITQKVDTIRTQLIRQMSARHDQANKWNELICLTFETMLMDSFNDSRSWQKSRYNLNDCVEHYFHVETYRAAYSSAIFPIPSMKKPSFDPTDFTIYPPTVKRPPGRPKRNRISSRGEKLKQIR
ncbi:uncharacterized protein LOC114277595 [Camellia sinensis]|uniref:uncharacterized protein LOC114277595 n=1 Tax=Camellia sinensis TaxID=4442 RepID=UPI001035F489|nr:uncharacterized protein LOC114277595 [Camellia sinensis]